MACVFCGSPETSEKLVFPEFDHLVNGEGGRAHCASLSELKTLISKSKLFVSNSTGPIHIAGALNKKIIGFFHIKF